MFKQPLISSGSNVHRSIQIHERGVIAEKLDLTPQAGIPISFALLASGNAGKVPAACSGMANAKAANFPLSKPQ
jgi:hypothetical protein